MRDTGVQHNAGSVATAPACKAIVDHTQLEWIGIASWFASDYARGLR